MGRVIAILGVSWACFAAPGHGDETFKTLVERISGEYSILKAGDEVPKQGIDSGAIEIEEGNAEFIFPYCPKASDLCESGYRKFPISETTLDRVTVSDGSTTYVFSKDGRKYEWIEYRSGRIVFRDVMHRSGADPVKAIDFELKK